MFVLKTASSFTLLYVCMYVCKAFSYANVRMYLVINYTILFMYVCVGPLCEPGLHELLHCHKSARFLQPPLRNSHPRHRPARSGYHLSQAIRQPYMITMSSRG